MELRQIAYLLAVVESASFTRAAEQLHVAQPGISAQIRRLERELGHELLDRSTRTIRPTPAGAAVLGPARAAWDAVAGMRTALDEFEGLLRGRVAVGTVATADPLGLPDRLAEFHHAHPAIEVTLVEATSRRLVDQLRDGGLDLAIVSVPRDLPGGLTGRVVTDRPLVAVVPPGHALEGRGSVPLHELVEQPLITMPAGSGTRESLDTGCAAEGLPSRIAFEASSPRTVTRLVARGLGVGVLPVREPGQRHDTALEELGITSPTMRARLVLAWRESEALTPAAAALAARLGERIGVA